MLLIMIWFLGSLILAALSWRAFADRTSSRFALFLAEVALWAVLVMSSPGWFRNVFSILQIVSWVLLTVSLVLGLSGFYALSGGGRSGKSRRGGAGIPHAATLVTGGPYRFIRHPVYMALILLGWGAAFKAPSFSGFVLAVIATGLLYYSSYLEEMENLERFGTEYDRYMETTRMLVPGVF